MLAIPNQIFCYTRCITLKRATNLRDPSPRHCARATQLFSNVAAVASRWQHCARFDWPRFELQTSRSRDDRVTARPTGRL